MSRAFLCLTPLFVIWLTPTALADPLPEKLVVATWNVEWFFDNYTGDNFNDLARSQSAPSRQLWDWKLARVAEVIAEIEPTILALQEIENRRVLFYLSRKLKQDHGLDYKIAYIEGEDFFTEQDVGVLALSGLVGCACKRQTTEMSASKHYYNINKHILCDFEWGSGPQKLELSLLNVHFRAQPDAGEIRTRQSRLARHWIDGAVRSGRPVIVLGDINTEDFFETAAPTGDLGTLRGLHTSDTADDLHDLFAWYKDQPKETHLVHKQFDHILVTPNLIGDKQRHAGVEFKSVAIRRDLVIRGQRQDEDHRDVYWTIPEAERDISDHYPVVAEFAVRP
jgi:endonuclease/exonuclease/phosphatase family metal-dependent hydrolase